MQDYILSKATNVECLMAKGKNSLGKCIELLGIHEEYLNTEVEEGFESWYEQKAGKRLWHYNNIGVKIIYKELDREYVGLRQTKYRISKSSLRRYGCTYPFHRVIVFEGTFVVLEKIIYIICSDENMKKVYYKYIHKETIQDYLDFQSKCLNEYISGEPGIRRNYYLEKIREPIEKMIQEVRKE